MYINGYQSNKEAYGNVYQGYWFEGQAFIANTRIKLKIPPACRQKALSLSYWLACSGIESDG